MPLIDIQRRLVQVGRIRMGERDDRGFPVRLEQWKLTSRDQVRLQAAAAVFGGKVQPWEGHAGEYELHTEVDSLPILLMPGQTISQHYELWSGGGVKRRCDGETEQLTDGPCLCEPGERECKPITRLNVLLPDVPGIGCWRLDSTGWNAAHELAGAVELLELATAKGVLLPARLRIDQRMQIKQGQTRRFPVPTLDIDVRPLELAAITRATASLPHEHESGQRGEITTGFGEPETYTPIVTATGAGVTVEEALAATAKGAAAPRTRTARSAAPMGEVGDFMSSDPLLVPDDGVKVTDDAAPVAETSEWKLDLTEKQWKKLNVLVGQLRDAGSVTTDNLYHAIAVARDLGVEDLKLAIGGYDAEGGLHWSPLRDSLSQEEASSLIDRLQTFQSNLAKRGAA